MYENWAGKKYFEAKSKARQTANGRHGSVLATSEHENRKTKARFEGTKPTASRLLSPPRLEKKRILTSGGEDLENRERDGVDTV